jgi:hypothetical protein
MRYGGWVALACLAASTLSGCIFGLDGGRDLSNPKTALVGRWEAIQGTEATTFHGFEADETAVSLLDTEGRLRLERGTAVSFSKEQRWVQISITEHGGPQETGCAYSSTKFSCSLETYPYFYVSDDGQTLGRCAFLSEEGGCTLEDAHQTFAYAGEPNCEIDSGCQLSDVVGKFDMVVRNRSSVQPYYVECNLPASDNGTFWYHVVSKKVPPGETLGIRFPDKAFSKGVGTIYTANQNGGCVTNENGGRFAPTYDLTEEIDSWHDSLVRYDMVPRCTIEDLDACPQYYILDSSGYAHKQ